MSLLIYTLILLGALLIGVPWLKKLGLNYVLSYLIIGLLLGATFFNNITYQKINADFFEYVSIIFIFLVGLASNPAKVSLIEKKYFQITSLQIILNTILFSSVSYFIFSQNIVTSFIISCAFALSSSALILQITKYSTFLSADHKSFVSILRIQSLMIVPFILIIQLMPQDIYFYHMIAAVAALIMIFTGLVLANRYLIYPFLKFLIKYKNKELMTLAGSFIIFFTLFITHLFNFNLLIAGFIAGILLADTSFSQNFKSYIQPYKHLVFGVFFSSIGIATPILLVTEITSTILLGVLLLIILKTLILFCSLRYFHCTYKNSIYISLALAQSGEFTFILLSVAAQERLISTAIQQQMFLIAALSMLLTPLVYLLIKKGIHPLWQKIQNNKSKSKAQITDVN